MTIKMRAWDKRTEELRGVMGFDYETQEIVLSSVPERVFAKGGLHTVHGLRRKLDEVKLLRSTGIDDVYKREIFEGAKVRFQGKALEVCTPFGRGFEHENEGEGFIRFVDGSFVITGENPNEIKVTLLELLNAYDVYEIEIIDYFSIKTLN